MASLGHNELIKLCDLANLFIYSSPGRYRYDFKYMNFKHNLGIDILSIKGNVTLEWISEDLVDGRSTLDRVMAWCRQVPEPVLTKICDTIWCHQATMSLTKYTVRSHYNMVQIEASAILMWSNITWFWTHHCRNWGRISIWGWTHKRHHIAHPNGRAMGCLLWTFWRELTELQWHLTVAWTMYRTQYNA